MKVMVKSRQYEKAWKYYEVMERGGFLPNALTFKGLVFFNHLTLTLFLVQFMIYRKCDQLALFSGILIAECNIEPGHFLMLHRHS
jgi:pentatricopeptide repeat protein